MINISQLSSSNIDYGALHNNMLDDFINKFALDESFISTLTSENCIAEIENRVDQYTNEYATENLATLGFTQSQYDNYLAWEGNNPFVLENESQDFKNFWTDLQNAIDLHYNSTSYEVEVNNVRATYESLITDGVYLQAIEAGCETAISSNQYWSDAAKTQDWQNYFNPTNSTARATRNQIIAKDALGAIGGVINGARAGMLLGGGGALAGGVIGFVAGAANASVSEYVGSTILSWLGFD